MNMLSKADSLKAAVGEGIQSKAIMTLRAHTWRAQMWRVTVLPLWQSELQAGAWEQWALCTAFL